MRSQIIVGDRFQLEFEYIGSFSKDLLSKSDFPAFADAEYVITAHDFFGNNYQAYIVVPVDTQSVDFSPLVQLIKDNRIERENAVFDKAFPAIAEVAGKVKRISIEDLGVIIEGEKSRASSNNYELLGTKIPVYLLIQLFPMALLVINLYLMIHLRQILIERSRRPEVDWRIAWIPCYSGIVTWISCILTLLAMPASLITWQALYTGAISFEAPRYGIPAACSIIVAIIVGSINLKLIKKLREDG